MSFRLVDKGWSTELTTAMRRHGEGLRIMSPFIKLDALQRLLDARRPRSLRVITRFSLDDFAAGVSDTAALRLLIKSGAKVRGVKHLHAKLYLFDETLAIATSANLTKAALDRNHEFGFVSDDPAIVAESLGYFDKLWGRTKDDLTTVQLDQWDAKIARHLAKGAPPSAAAGLGDYGANAGIEPEPPPLAPAITDAGQAFVKFFGNSKDRLPLSASIFEEVAESGSHWALTYPASKRPRAVIDGAVMYISRLTRDPNDIRIIGRAIGMQHNPERDNATLADLERRPWKESWPRYIRVHHAEFLAGTLANGISLHELMDALEANAFAATQRNLASGEGNTDPRRAFMQQPAVELSPQGASWLEDRLAAAFLANGRIPAADLAKLDWPDVPSDPST
jgi:hypothetical protein